MRSLRWQLLLGTILVSGAILAILGICIDHAVRRTLIDDFDRVLVEKGRGLATMVEQRGDNVHFDFEAAQFPEFEPAEHPAYFQISLDGKFLWKSPSLREGQLPDSTVLVNLPDGSAGRMMTVAFEPYIEPGDEDPSRGKPHGGLVLIAQNTTRLDNTLANIRILIAGLCGAAALLCGAAMFLIVHRAVRPVRKLAGDIEKLPETNLAVRLDPGGLPDELLPVVNRLNDLLARLGGAFDRERAFTADVAHELRTPLAGLLASLEVSRSRPRDAASYEATMDKSLAMLLQMRRLIENLLLLSRADSRQLAVASSGVDCVLLLDECWIAFEPVARARQLACAIQTSDAQSVKADPELLRLILNNLMDNAISYCTERGRVEIRTSGAKSHFHVEIVNSCKNLSSDDIPNLGQRFWRKDESRSATGIHAGLGLSICTRLAVLQNIDLTFRVDQNMFIAALDIPTQL